MGLTLPAVIGLVGVAVLGLIYVVYRLREGRALSKRYMGPALERRRGFQWRKDIPVVLLLIAVALLVLSFAQFRLVSESTPGTAMLVMDTSRSMLQTDVVPDRLTAAQNAAETFLEQLPPEIRVGLVTFAGEAELLVAPTADRQAVVDAIRGVEPTGGTVIGDGLSTALIALKDEWSRDGEGPAAAILLSDGRDTGSRVPPQEAAQEAASLEVPIFTVVLGVASAEGPGANTALLQQIAEITGARSFSAGTAAELTSVYEALGSQLSLDLAIGDLGPTFLFAAIVFAVAAGATLIFSMRLPEFRPRPKVRRAPRRTAPTIKRPR